MSGLGTPPCSQGFRERYHGLKYPFHSVTHLRTSGVYHMASYLLIHTLLSILLTPGIHSSVIMIAVVIARRRMGGKRFR